MSALLGVPVDAAYHLVLVLADVLTPLLGGLAGVAGIVVLTAAVRLLVMPLSFRALRGQAAQARLAPRIQRLRASYGRQPDRLQRELTALYRREGTSVFAGFAPLLVQWPVFSVLYLLFRSPSVAGGPNLLLSRDFLGVPLGGHWLSAGLLTAHDAVFLGVLGVLAVTCWLSAWVARRMTTALAAPALAGQDGQARERRALGGGSPVQGARGQRGPGAGGVLGVLGKVLPYLTVAIAAFAPLAAAVYLVVSTGWSAAERWVFTRYRHREAIQPGTAASEKAAANARRRSRK